MKRMPQSQPSSLGSRFLDNLCAQWYWSFKLLPQTCGVPIWDDFPKTVCVVFLRSPVAGAPVLLPTWAVTDALTFLWFILDESWCLQHVSCWKGWFPRVIAGFKTESHFCAVNLNLSFSQDGPLVLSCALKGTSRQSQQQEHTPRETSSPQSQHLFMYTRFCVHLGSFYSHYDIQVKK